MCLWMHQFYFINLFPIGPLSPACSLSRSGLGPSRAEVGFGSCLVGCVRRFCPPPLLWLVFWPVVRPLFLFPCPFRVCPFGPGVLVLVLSLFPFPFCVPRLVFRLSHCHLIFIVISFSSFLHLHLHLIRRDLKKPRGSGACVWNI